MAIYRVECVNRQTGVAYPVLIEALKPDDAAEACSVQGHLVGRVVQERDLPVGTPTPGRGGAVKTDVVPGPVAVPEVANGSRGGVKPPVGASQAALMPTPVAALTAEESELLRELVEHLTALRRSPLIKSPRRTIAAGVLLGLGGVSIAGMIVAVIMVVLGVAGFSRVLGEVGDGGQLQQLEKVLQP